jgi:hypothetical protein
MRAIITLTKRQAVALPEVALGLIAAGFPSVTEPISSQV